MAMTGTYTDDKTGQSNANAYAEIFPVELQSIVNPYSGALPYARYDVKIWVSHAAYTAGKQPISTIQYVAEGDVFLSAFANAAAQCFTDMRALDAAADVALKMEAMKNAIIGVCESHALTMPEFGGWLTV